MSISTHLEIIERLSGPAHMPPDALHVFKAELRQLLATIRREQSNLDRLNRYTHLTRSMRDDRNLSCDRIADANRRIEEMLR